MDSEEQDESSNSQSVRVLSLKERGNGKESWEVLLSTGASFFMPFPFVANWEIGRVLTPKEYDLLLQEDSYLRGREWAAGRLALREDSSGRMYKKLLQKGYPSDLSHRIIQSLEDFGFLDDRRFGSLWVQERLRTHPEGKMALEAGLRHRGVPSAVAREVVEKEWEGLEEDQLLAKAARKLERVQPSREKITRQLLCRGFSPGSIHRYLALKE